MIWVSLALASPKADVKAAELAVQRGDVAAVAPLVSRALAAGKLSPAWQARGRLARAEANAYRLDVVAPAAVAADYTAALAADPEVPRATDVQTVLANALLADLADQVGDARWTRLEALVAVRDDAPNRLLQCDAAGVDHVEAVCAAAVQRSMDAERPSPSFVRATLRLVMHAVGTGDGDAASNAIARADSLLERQQATTTTMDPEEADLLGEGIARARVRLDAARLTAALLVPSQAPVALRLVEERLAANPEQADLHAARARLLIATGAPHEDVASAFTAAMSYAPTDPAHPRALGEHHLAAATALRESILKREMAGEVVSAPERTRMDMQTIEWLLAARPALERSIELDERVEVLTSLRTVVSLLGDQRAEATLQSRINALVGLR